MPIYAYLCEGGHDFERFLPLADYASPQTCECGKAAQKQLCAPLVVADLPGYQSPVDGRWIEGRKARREDLARNNCVPYEPSMKSEQQRRLARSNAEIDKKVDEHVEAEVAKMPARKREKLEAELRGHDVAVERGSVSVGTRVEIAQ